MPHAHPSSAQMLANATANVIGPRVSGVDAVARTYQATIAGTGPLTATVLVQVSNLIAPDDASDLGWITLATLSLSGNGSDTQGANSVVPWMHTRFKLTGISGTGAAVNGYMGY